MNFNEFGRRRQIDVGDPPLAQRLGLSEVVRERVGGATERELEVAERLERPDHVGPHAELGAQASAVAITAGANAQASTAGGASAGAGDTQKKANYKDGLAIFTAAKGGLMYEASVGGQKFSYKAMTK